MRAPVFALLLSFGACTGGGGGEIVVQVRTDWQPGVEFVSVRTALDAQGTEDLTASFGDDYVDGVRVASFPDVPAGMHRFHVSLLGLGGVVLAERPLLVQVSGNAAVTAVITRSCGEVTCPAPGGDAARTACFDGACVEPTCTAETPEACGSLACAADGDCAAPAAACASAACVHGACLATALVGACGETEWCHPVGGCEPLEPSASPYRDAVLADGPVLYLRLGDPAGEIRAFDESGQGTDGAYVNAVTLGAPGALEGDADTAVTFDGGPSEVRLPDVLDFVGLAPFSLEAWVLPTDIDGAANIIVAHGEWILFMQSGTLKFQRGNVDPWEGPWFNGLPVDRYSHVVGTFDGSTMRLYVDGLDVGSTPGVIELADTTNNMTVGTYFGGTLDEVAVYDQALTAGQVLVHYRVGNGMAP